MSDMTPQPRDLAQTVADLRIRLDSLERQVRALQQAAPSGPATAPPSAGFDAAAFADKLVAEVARALKAQESAAGKDDGKDDGKALGPMENGVMHDTYGVLIARYQLPDGRVLIWRRDEQGGGFTLRVAEPSGQSHLYIKEHR